MIESTKWQLAVTKEHNIACINIHNYRYMCICLHIHQYVCKLFYKCLLSVLERILTNRFTQKQRKYTVLSDYFLIAFKFNVLGSLVLLARLGYPYISITFFPLDSRVILFLWKMIALPTQERQIHIIHLFSTLRI